MECCCYSIIFKIHWQTDEHRTRSELTDHSTATSATWSISSLQTHVSEGQNSSSQVLQTYVGWQFHRVCPSHRRWMNITFAHPRSGRLREVQVDICLGKIRVPMCRRIDQTRWTRRTSSSPLWSIAGEDQNAGGDTDAQRHRQLSSSAEGDSVADEFFPASPQSAERKSDRG